MSTRGLKSANRLAPFTLILVLATVGMILTSLPPPTSSSVAPASLPQFPVGSGSWNNLVGCTSPWIVRISDITDNMTASASLANSIFSPGINTTFGTAKRWLTPGNSTIHPPSGWHSPGPPCSIINSHGNVSMFVEIDGLRLSTNIDQTGDCTTNYDPVNGGGSNGGNYCDTDFNVYDPTMVPNYANACLNSSDPTCYGIIHIEIDHDWKAARYCAPGSVCDAAPLNSTLTIDVQGFVYYDPGHFLDQWHSFSGWEIHAVTAWRVHQFPTPSTAPPGSYFDHIVTILMENKGISDICGFNPSTCTGGTNNTYLDGLAKNYTLAKQYTSLFPGSLPNYVALLGASTNGCTSAICPTITAANLVDRMEAAGVTWKGYMENQPSSKGCATSDSLPYLQRHNPFVQYQDITSSILRCNKIVLANPTSCGSVTDCALINDLNSASAPSFMWLTPNVCNDMHGNNTCTNGCSHEGASPCILDGNNYLASLIPNILKSNTFKTQRSVIFIVFDEGIDYCPLNNSNQDCLYAVWAGPEAKNNFASSNMYSHYSYTKTIEVNWNLTSITSNDALAAPMTEFLNPVQPIVGKYFDHLVVIMMENEGLNNLCGGTALPPCQSQGDPYLTSLANTYGVAQNYTELINTSEPNYFGILGASLFGCSASNNTACFPTVGTLTALNLVDRFSAAGVSWKGYFENMTSNCAESTQEPYQHEHNPFTPFADIVTNATRCSDMVLVNPTGCGAVTDCKLINDLNSSSIPNFMWLTPNDCNNMHGWSGCTNGCTTTNGGAQCIVPGDNYLKSLVPEILNSKAFLTTRSALFIVFDEGAGGGCPLNGKPYDCLYNVWAGPVANRQLYSATSYSQYSLTKTIEVNWNLATLTSNDANAKPMAEFIKKDYAISGNPAILNTLAGASSTSTVTVTAYNNFSGTVNLTASSSPSGPSLTLSPTSVTMGSSGTATSSLSVTGPPTAGNYTITVTGTSGSLSRNATITLQVQDYSISSNPVSLKTNVNSPGSFTLTITSLNHFIGRVFLQGTGTTGLSTSISPGSIVGGSGTATLTVTASTAGNYTATVAGTSGNLNHTVQVSVQVVDFTITAATLPSNLGSSTTSTITISSLNHFTGTVMLSDTVPSGVSCSAITPTSITASGTATVSCTSSTAGNYTLTITGVSGGLSHSVTTSLRFQDFSLAANPTNIFVNAGTQASSNITATSINGFNGVVNLTTNSTSCTITPTSLIGSGVAVLSCNFQSVGTFHVSVTGTNGGLTHTVVVTYTVKGFSVTANPTSVTVSAGATGTSTVTATSLNGFTGTVSLSTAISPSSGLTCTLTPASIVLGSSGTSTLSCSGQSGTYTVTISGTATAITNTASVTFTVQDFTLTATSPAPVTAGSTATSTTTLLPANGFSSTVSLTSTVTSGLTCGAITPSSLTGSGTATISCSSALSGTYSVTITGMSGSLTHTATAIFQITDFSITASTPATVTVNASTTSTVSVAFLNGFTGTVNLTDTIPSGLGCGSISPASLSATGTAIVSCTSSVAGSYSLTITGTSGSLTHSTTTTFTITDFTIAATSPAAITAGTTASSTITVTSVNGFTGTVALTDTLPSGLFCGSITPGTLSNSGTATVSCNATVAGNYVLTITGTTGSLSHSATATFQVTGFTIVASSPTNVTVGTSTNVTITITAVNGFTGTVSLTDTPASGQSCGAITPSSLANSGTASVSCSAPVAANYLLTITGTNGGVTHSATTSFHVTDFTISASSPAPVQVGIPAASTITLTAVNGFTGTISLTDFIPSGLICGTITPSTITNSGTTTVACDANNAGNYTLTLTGTSGSLSHSASATFVVQDFTITANPTTVTVNAGTVGTSTITATGLNGFAGSISLTTNSTSCTLSPSSITGSGSSTLSCTFAAAGTVHVGVTGTSGSQAHSVTVTFVLQDFTIAAAPASVNVSAGSTGTSTITVSGLNGFAGVATLISNSTSCSLSPTSVSGSGSSTLSCALASVGTVHVGVTGTSGSLSHFVTVTFVVQDFTIAGSPSSVTVNAGSAGTSTVTVTGINGFAGVVALTTNSTSCSLSPTSVTGFGSSTLSCTFAGAGSVQVAVTGTNGSLSHGTTVTFVLQDFTINAAPTSVTVNAGSAGTSTITVTGLNGFSGVIALTTNSTSCSLSPTSVAGSGSSTFSCTFGTAGTNHIGVTGASSSLSHSITVALVVQDFTITASQTSVNSNVNAAGTSTITVTALNGFAGVVSLTTNSTSCSLAPTSVTGSGTSAFSCTFTSVGTFQVGMTASSAALSHSVTVAFVIQDFTVTVNPTTVTANVGTASSTVTVAGLNGFSGTVSLTTNNSSCTASPSSVTGSGTAGVTCTISTAGNYTIILTGASTTLVHTTTILFRFQDFTISATSPAQVIVPSSSSSTITVSALNGFNGTVNLTDTPPTGLSCGAITPNTITGPGTATISCFAAIGGNYTLTISGTSSSISHSTTTLFKYSDFSVTASTPSAVDNSQPATSTVTISSLNRFTGTITLSRSMTPGLSCGNPSPTTVLGSGVSSLTCSASMAGNYTLQIRGSSGTLLHISTITIKVIDFGVAASPSQLTSPVATNTTSTVTITGLNGYTGTVNVTAALLIQGSSTSGGSGGRPNLIMSAPGILPDPFVTPSSILIGTSGTRQTTLTIVLLPGTLAGNYTIILSATDGTLTRTTQLTITVTDFSLTNPTNNLTISPGTNSTITLTFQSLNGFQSTINVTSTMSPTGPVASLNPSVFLLSTTSTSQLTIAVPVTTTMGNYTLTIQAISGSLLHTITITITVSTGHTSLLTGILDPTNITASGITGLLSIISLAGVQLVRTKRTGKARGPRSVSDRITLRQFSGVRDLKPVAVGPVWALARTD